MDTGSFSENLSSRLSPDQNCSNTEPSSTLKGLIRSPCGGSKKTAPYSFLCPCSWWRGVCLPLRPPPHPPTPLLATPTLKLKSASAQKPVTATEALFRNRGQKYSSASFAYYQKFSLCNICLLISLIFIFFSPNLRQT